jgi:hypothetical protein
MEETVTPSADKRSVGIKFGLIGTVAGIAYFVLLLVVGQNPLTFKWGWAFQVPLGIVLIILAHKAYKEENNGFMTYGEGVVIGLWYTLIGVGVGMLFNYIYLNFIDPNLLTDFYDSQYEQMQQKGMGDDQIAVAQTWTKKLYWPIGLFAATFFSMIIVFVVTIFTQKKPPEQRF